MTVHEFYDMIKDKMCQVSACDSGIIDEKTCYSPDRSEPAMETGFFANFRKQRISAGFISVSKAGAYVNLRKSLETGTGL